MKFIKTELNDVLLIQPDVFEDSRGFFLESYSSKKFEDAGIKCLFVQDNHSRSKEQGVIRGLHFQLPPFAQSKLIRVTRGAIYDVVIDLRKESSTFGKYQSFELTEKNFMMLFIPQGFAHGLCTLSPVTEVQYKVDNFYAPACDSGIRWNDPTFAINWPVKVPVLSKKDAALPFFNEIKSPF